MLLSYRLRGSRRPRGSRCGAGCERLGVAQLADGLVALPADARTREQLEWVAEEVVEAGGTAGVWLARPDDGRPGTGARRRRWPPPGPPSTWSSPTQCRAAARSGRRSSGAGRCAGCGPSGGRSAGATSSRRRSARRPGGVAALAAAIAGDARVGAGAGPMRWATRAGVHIDRAACAWLIRRFLDPDAEFVFVADPAEVPADATPFDMRGVDLGHHGGDCSFETILRRYELTDPVLWRIAEIVHEADLDDDRFDAPEAPGPRRRPARAVDDRHRRRTTLGRGRPALRRPLRVPPPPPAARPRAGLTPERPDDR